MTIVYIIISVIIGAIIGGIGLYLILRPKITTIIELNQENLVQNEKIKHENQKLIDDNIKFSQDKIRLEEQLNSARSSLIDLETQATQAAESIYQKSLDVMQERLSAQAEKLGQEYQEKELEYQEEYKQVMADLTLEIQNAIDEKQIELSEVNAKLTDLLDKFAAAVAANKRIEEEKTAESFYCLQLSDEDLTEITVLRDATQFLRNKEPINKVIWKVYYEKAYTDLIGRVVGKGQKTGIYKITNLETQMCYVGQAVDISNRWKQHIKRGIGAETPTKNKLYPAMLMNGVENFKFEIIQECPANLLSEREKYWQDVFGAKEFGYSIK